MNVSLKRYLSCAVLPLLLLSCKKQLTDAPPKTVLIKGRLNNLNAFDYSPILVKQAAYIASCQLADGEIMDVPEPNNRICPYFENIACLGLLANPTSANITVVKKWMTWYMAHLNGSTNPVTSGTEIPGSIYDYFGAAQTTNGTYDSIDSYAATFLVLAKRLAEASPADRSWLSGYSYQLTLIGNALTTCIDNSSNLIPNNFGADNNDGLTIASYVYPAKYLMDNAEVNDGFRAITWLESNVITGGSPTYYLGVTTAHTSAIESYLWNGTMYNWYDPSSTTPNSSWSKFSPDAGGQLFPVIYDVIAPTSTRAISLYNSFNTYYPLWSSGHTYDTVSHYPNVFVCYAAAKMADSARVNGYLNYTQSFGTGNPANWFTAEAGFTMLAAQLISTMNPSNVNLASGRGAYTSTSSTNGVSPALAIDGSLSTRWSGDVADNQWWEVDLGVNKVVSRIVINWEAAYATSYRILTSNDNTNFYDAVPQITGADGGNDTITFSPINARYIRIVCNTRVNTAWGSSFWEVGVY